MTTHDYSPLYRTLVGFDRIANLIDQATRLDAAPGYPPFNIEQTGDDAYRIELAVAGFGSDDLAIEVKESLLTIAGKRSDNAAADRKFIHRGIAERSFERRFQLADHVQVRDARLENGLLTLDLVREVPEAAKPRRIAIKDGLETKPAGKVIEGAKKADSKAA